MSDENDDNEIEFIDTDNFDYNKQESFSHEMLVMVAYRRCLECLAKEMREGFWQEKYDKNGNAILTYNPDARKEAVEAVKTLKNTMISDISQTNFQTAINGLINSINIKRNELLKIQGAWFDNMHIDARHDFLSGNPSFYPNYLYDKLPFYQDYIEFQIEVYRNIFEQLELALKATKYFKKPLIIY